MLINTTNFGEITIDESKMLFFNQGLVGYDGVQKFALISMDDKSTFYILQSIDKPGLIIPCVNPLIMASDYGSKIPGYALSKIGVTEDTEVMLLVVSIITENLDDSYANLNAPIIVNTEARLGMQIIIDDMNIAKAECSLSEIIRDWVDEIC